MGTPAARKKYKYELLAERLAVVEEWDISPMERGTQLESQALEFFETVTGKIVDEVGFAESDKSPYIASSPDGLIKVNGEYREAVEIKCPSSAVYLESWLEEKIPKEYFPQVIQYFIVNENLEKLYFVLYDPRILAHPMHVMEVNRDTIQETIDDYEQKELELIQEVEELVEQLVQF